MARIPQLPIVSQFVRKSVPDSRLRELSLPTIISCSVGIAGFAAVFCSAFTSWFTVPVAASLAAPIVSEAPLVSWAYRVAALAVSSAAFLIFIRDSWWRQRLERLYLCWFVAVLFFPYFVTIWSPGVAGRASWLQSQHQSLTAGTGDIQMTQEYKGSLLRHRVDVANLPMETQVIWLPDRETQSFGWKRPLDVLQLFGFSNWFLSFFKRGWPLALGGSVAILLAVLRGEAEPNPLRAAGKFLPPAGRLFVASLMVALVPIFIGEKCIIAAKRYAQAGDYASAYRLMQWSARFIPAITQDGQYFMQTGLLADALGSQNSAGAYYRARITEEAGFHFQARTMYFEGLIANRSQPALLREDVKGVLRQAANAFNSGELKAASVLLEEVLVSDPVNVKANYALQLAYLRSGNIDGLRALRQRMRDVYAYFNTPLKASVLAVSSENLAAGELFRGDAAAALKTFIEARTP